MKELIKDRARDLKKQGIWYLSLEVFFNRPNLMVEYP